MKAKGLFKVLITAGLLLFISCTTYVHNTYSINISEYTADEKTELSNGNVYYLTENINYEIDLGNKIKTEQVEISIDEFIQWCMEKSNLDSETASLIIKRVAYNNGVVIIRTGNTVYEANVIREIKK